MRIRKLFAAAAAALFFTAAAGTAAFAGNTGNNDRDDTWESLHFFKEATLTIENPKPGHTYEAYQIFKDERIGFETFYYVINAEWGRNVDGDAIVADLENDNRGFYWGLDRVKDGKTAYTVALYLYDNKTHQPEKKLKIFAGIAASALNGEAPFAVSEHKEGSNLYTIRVDEPGFYLIRDRITEDSPIAEGDAATSYICWKADTKTIKVKADAPSLEKKILEGSEEKDTSEASIGDSVQYLLKSRVPDMEGYDTYSYEIRDTLSAGLTFQNDVKVMIGGKEADPGCVHVSSSENADRATSISIRLDLLGHYAYDPEAETPIRVTYSALLNTDAVIGGTGNPNEAKLMYSNNPAESGEGHVPKGSTPLDKVVTYTGALQVMKMDTVTGDPLAGAEFRLTGESVNQVKVVTKTFTRDDRGTYYKLKSGAYTQAAPEAGKSEAYASTEERYRATEKTEIQQKKENVDVTAAVGEDGIVRFDGIGASGANGYQLTETKAPDGYQGLSKPITVYVDCALPKTEDDPTFSTPAAWTFRIGSGDAQGAENGVVKTVVENAPHVNYPGAGGRGTFLLTILGVSSLAAAIGLAAANRRKRS